MSYPATFASLAHRNFRLFWFGQLISLVGTWLQQVAQSWFVLTLTNSAFMLGAVSAISSLPILLLALPGGVVADRVPKRSLLIFTQSVAMLMAFMLAGLVHFHLVRLWHIIAIAAVSGSAFAFDAPARQSYQAELVPRGNLLNAIALNSAIFNGARIMGPALAGILYAAIGPSGCFFLNGLSFLAVIYGLWLIDARLAPPPKSLSAWDDMRTGVTYVWRAPAVRGFIIIVAAFSIFGLAYAALMPVFARDILHVGARGFGFLMTATGAGALAGALGLATFSRMKRRGDFVFGTGLLFAAAVTVLAQSRNYYLSMAAMPVIGFAMVSQVATVNTIIQHSVPDDIRGRAMSVFTFMFMGMTPFGSFIAGSIAGKFGAPAAVQTGAIACVVTLAALYWGQPKMRKV
ncbi:MAG: MFS transporter [Candidatus Edwardsbacteria bacterium]|nr:MFS transporter [Candidatus Edwardsbacteria bacterium]